MSNDIKRQLKNLKKSDVSPRPEWLKASRARLISQISNTVPAEKPNAFDNFWLGLSIFLPQSFVFGVVRPVAVLLIVAMVGTSGWIATVDASYEALPGDWLYPAKRVMEATQAATVSIIGDTKAEIELHAEFAKRRATEIQGVVNGDDPQKQDQMTATVSDLKEEINSVSIKLEEMKSVKTEGTAAMVQEVQKSTDQINTVLKEVKEDLTTDGSAEGMVIAKEIGEAKDMAKDVSVKAVEVMVVNHLDGDVTKEEVATAIDKTMQNALSEANATKQNIDSVKTIVDAATEVKDAVGTTTPATEKLDTVAAQTTEAAAQTTEAAATVDQKATEIKTMVENGDLVGAISAVKEATETTKAMDKLQDTTLTSAQTVLPTPVVAAVKEQIASVTQSASTTAVTIIITTTTQTIEPGKLPIVVIVTTTPAVPTSTPAATSTAATTTIIKR